MHKRLKITAQKHKTALHLKTSTHSFWRRRRRKRKEDTVAPDTAAETLFYAKLGCVPPSVCSSYDSALNIDRKWLLPYPEIRAAGRSASSP